MFSACVWVWPLLCVCVCVCVKCALYLNWGEKPFVLYANRSSWLMASEKSVCQVFPLDLVYWFLSFCLFDLIWVGVCTLFLDGMHSLV